MHKLISRLTTIVGITFCLMALLMMAMPLNLEPVFADGAPEISLSHQGIEIPNGDTTPSLADFTDYGSVAVGTGVSMGGYNINNAGTAELHLTSESPYVFITGADAAEFSLRSVPPTSIRAGSSIPIQIYFHPSSPGLKTATVSIPNDDSDENPYTFSIQGTGVESAPEIYITGNGVEIVDRHNSPNPENGTDFGTMNPGGESSSRTFMIYNTGTAALNLTGTPKVTFSGLAAADFTVTAQPVSPINAGGSTSFQVTFTPSASGIRNATVSIMNDDSDENEYTFSIRGNGAYPALSVTYQSTVIASGDTTPSTTDGTDFGSAQAGGGSVAHVFYILNYGTATVNLTGTSPYIQITGTNAADFTVTTPPISTIPTGSGVMVRITFHPSAAGLRTAIISFWHDASGPNPYTFSVQGTGQAMPEMTVSGNGHEIVNGDTTPSKADFTDFGGTEITTGSVVHSFTINNSGLLALNLTGTPRVAVSGANAADFTVTTQPVSPVAGNDSTTFQITFHPSASGLRTAIVSIANNDSNENPYNFNIQGTGGLGEIKVTGNGQEIVDGDTTPSTADNTNIGSTPIFHYPISATFRIYNNGSNTLYLSGTPAVAISGANAGEFTVSTPPATSVEPGGYTSFTVTFRPITPGTKTATVSIDNNDPDESPYNFTVQGFGTSANLVLSGNGREIVNPDMTPSTTDFTDFGAVNIGSSGVTHTFTVINTGNAPYELFSEYPYIGTNNTDFTITSVSALVIPVGGSITIQINFRPSAAGMRQSDVLITNKWGDEENVGCVIQYNFRIQGTGIGPEMRITGNGYEITDGDTTPSPTDATEFGTADLGSGSVVHSFSIVNSGTGPLNLSGTPLVTVSGDAAADFTVTILPVSSVAAGSSTTFQITFNPSAFGLRNATVTVANNDPDENPYNFSIRGTGSGPEMRITCGNILITNGNSSPSKDFGATNTTSGSLTFSFTIFNAGAIPLNLTGTPLVAISGANAADFTVVLQPSTPVNANGGSTTFQIRFNPSVDGLRTATVTIANNDPDENPYTFSIQGIGTTLGITVSGNGQEIANSDTSPSTADFTDFGTINIHSGSVAHTFTITNTGSTQLNLTGTPPVAISGANAADFTVTALPVSPIASSGGSTSFQVTFNPSATGLRNAIVTIANNDPNKNPYTFSIHGISTTPGITVSGNGYTILDGDSSPQPEDFTDFGIADVNGETTERIFTISNTGSIPLNLTGTPLVTISGANAADFTVSISPSTPVMSTTGNTTFQIAFRPSAIGLRNATVSIANDDINKNPYNFDIQGTGTGPGINLKQDTTAINNGGTYDFGSHNISTNTDVIFTIQNTGTAELTITIPLTISGANADQFSVISQPDATVAANGNTSFTVRFNPVYAGDKTAIISISIKDYVENPYNLIIAGSCVGQTTAPPEENHMIIVESPGFIENKVVVNKQGIVEGTFSLKSINNDITLVIPTGTKILDAQKNTLTEISVRPVTEIPAPPPKGTIALMYDFGADGATFEPSITLRIPYRANSGEVVSLAYWSGTAWVLMETDYDPVTGELLAEVTHFTIYAVIVTGQEPVEVPSQTTPASVEPTSDAPAVTTPTSSESLPSSETTDEPGAFAWYWWLVIVLGALIVIGLIVLFTRTRHD